MLVDKLGVLVVIASVFTSVTMNKLQPNSSVPSTPMMHSSERQF